MTRLVPHVLLVAVITVLALCVVTRGESAKPKAISAARYSTACADAYRAVRWYRARYNEHRQTLGYTPAPPVEQAMSCRRLRERAAYWVRAAKVNRQAVERRYTLPVSNDWRTSVLIVQRAFPGTASWLLSCSSAEGGHGGFVLYGGRRYYPGAEHSQTFHGDMVGGNLQYMWGTFRGHYRRGLEDLRARGFRVDLPPPHDVRAWLMPMGQAVAGAWGITHGQRSHWYASFGNGC